MGFKNTIVVRHIRGEQFEVEVERDADCLGLKLLIFEAKGIPIERQRLVYAGKEIKDTDVLIALGIEGSSTVYLVETNGSDAVEAVAIVNNNKNNSSAVYAHGAPVPSGVGSMQVVSMAAAATPQIQVQPQQQHIQVQMPEQVPQQQRDYARLSGSELGPNGKQILKLTKSVRRFLFFSLFMACTFGLMLGLFDLLVIGLISMGLYATKKMRPLWLWGPIALTKLTALGLIIGSIIGMAYHFCPFEILTLIVGILVGVVCACIFKLFVLMNGCNNQQLEALRNRAVAQSKCCFRCC